MKLFFIKPKIYSPLLFFICKVGKQESVDKIESLGNELFNFLIEQKYANTTNILIFSIIKDHEKKTMHIILPSIESNNSLIDRCHNHKEFLNAVLVDSLKKFDSEFYVEVNENELTVRYERLSLIGINKYFN